MAGHSLGELAALVAAGALAEADGLALVTLRGALMHEAGRTEGQGGMVVVMGRGASERAPEVALAHGLVLANDNSPQQVVLSGSRAALPDAVTHAKDLGLRAMELDVTGAFHSPMMASAVPQFESALAATKFSEPVVPVLSAVTAAPFTDPRRELAEALTMPGALARDDADPARTGRDPLHRGRPRPGADRAGQADAAGRGARQCLRRTERRLPPERSCARH